MNTRVFSMQEARDIAQKINLDPNIDLEQFRQGLAVELEHGIYDFETNVTNDDLLMTGKIAWAHLKEIPDYYTRLAKMEQEAGKELSHETPIPIEG